jgi:hypothetical protein
VSIHKIHPNTGHVGPEGKERYSFNLSLTSSLDERWVVNATSRQLYNRETDPIPIVKQVGWASGPVWTGAEILAPPGLEPRTLKARSQSLSRPCKNSLTEMMYTSVQVLTTLSGFSTLHFKGDRSYTAVPVKSYH